MATHVLMSTYHCSPHTRAALGQAKGTLTLTLLALRRILFGTRFNLCLYKR